MASATSSSNGAVIDYGPLTTRDPRLRAQSRTGAFSEIGTTGLKQYGGFVLEEWLAKLQGKRGAWAYREMLDNSAVVGSIMFAIKMLARQVEWPVEGSDEKVAPDLLATDFVKSCMHDMSHTWGDFVSEALSFLGYGWALHEEVLKRRLGEQPDLPSRVGETEEDEAPASSRFDDGLIGWRKLPLRAQDTLLCWDFDGYAGVRAMQQVDWHGGSHVIPIAKSLLFRTEATKNNPEGRSILRNAFESYFYMKNIQTDEAIGISRDLVGIPKAKPPPSVDIFAPQHKALLERVQELVTSIEKDEQQGIVLPSSEWEIELMRTGGTRMVDTDPVIRRYRQEIASSVLADFVLVGLDNLGSYAMVDVKAQLFGLAMDAILDIICEVFNRYAIPRLFRANGFQVKTLPRITHSSAGRLDLEKVANFFYNMAGAGAPIPWSEQLMAQLFAAAGLPANFAGESTSQQNVDHAGRTAAPAPQPLTKADHSAGAMVALYPSPEVASRLAQPGGEPADGLHVTLAYLGDAVSLSDTDRLRKVVEGFAAACSPILGVVSGVGHFTSGPEPVTYASVDAPALAGVRERLVQTLGHAGFPPAADHGFTPHMTLAYDTLDPQLGPAPLAFGELALVLGGERYGFPLRGVAKADDAGPKVLGHIAPVLADRARVLSLQLEGEINGALGLLGGEAAAAYLTTLQKAESPRQVARRVLAKLNVKGWVQSRLMPILRNHSGRVAGDTQRVLQAEVGAETKLAEADIARLARQAGSKFRARDIEPQVREAIMRAVDEALAHGDNPEATARRIRDMVPPGRFVNAGAPYRARLIARTETLHQQRLATLAAYANNPHIQNVRVRDGIFGPPRSDEECIDRSGDVVPVAEAAALAPELHPMCSVSYDPVVEPTAQPVAV